MDVFKPRLKKPEKGNKYYIRKVSGGYNPAIQGKPLYKGCDALANCQPYAIGRFSEESDEGKVNWFGSMNACSVYIVAQRHGLEVGQTPKEGAIMCWSGGSDGRGHNAISEVVKNLTEVKTSESAYEHYIFKNITRKKGKDGNWGMGSKYKFQGFVYNPNLVQVAKPVERDENVNQLKILKAKLRIRVQPSLSANILDFAEKDGIYNDLETCKADGYTWHKIAENNWLAEVSGYVELLPKVEFYIGDKVTVKEQPEYYIIDFIDGSNVNITMTTTIDNLNKYEEK